MQANTNEDRKAWLEVMEGKEPVYTSLKVLEVAGVTPDMHGYDFVTKCVCVIEDRGKPSSKTPPIPNHSLTGPIQ